MVTHRHRIPDVEEPVTVYRLYDAKDSLLYIGQTRDFHWRLHNHREEGRVHRESWRATIDHWTTQEYSSREAALNAERLAILAEAPLHNIQVHNPWKIGAPTRKGNPWLLAQTLRMAVDEGGITIREAFAEMAKVGISAYRAGHWFGMTNAYHDANGKWVRLLTAERLIAYNA